MTDHKDTEQLPPNDQRCTTKGWKWRCKHYKFNHSKFCRKHYLLYRGPIDGLSKKNRASLYGIDFKVGQEVEVSRKDQSLKLSAWFKAKILELPTNTRIFKRKSQVFVQYNEMDLGSENVDFSLMRPLPLPLPPLEGRKSFDLHQRVEAFCNGGWWKGEIFEVLENGRYIVDCAIWGEKREVGVNELRVHQDWIDGEWVVPIYKGRDVGTNGIVDESDQKKKAPMSRGRGSPHRKMDKGDTGVVSLSGQKEDVGESSISKDPKRTTPDRIMTESCSTTSLIETDFSQTGSDVGTNDIVDELDQKKKAPVSRGRGRPRKKMHKEDRGGVSLSGQKEDVGESSISKDSKRTTPDRIITDSCRTANFMGTDFSQTDRNVGTDGVSNESDQRKRKTPTSRPRGRPLKKMHKEDTGVAFISEDLTRTIPVGTQWVDLSIRESSQNYVVRSLSDGAQVDSSNNEVHLLQMSTKNTKSLNGDENSQLKRAVEEQSNVVTEPSAQVPHFIPESGEAADAVQSMKNIKDASIVDRVTSNLPFTKSYPLWETLETMEVFKSMQQLPHFRPLAEENEYIREGEAIGYMLSFLAAAEKIRKFKFDESDGTIAETLIALKDFEDLGFDVHIIKDRLEKLLRIKTDFLEYDMERKQIKAEILKEKLEEKRLELSVAEMTEKMREFQEARSNMMKEREIVLMKKQANDSELTALKRSIQETMDEMQQINLQFTSVVAKPW